MIAVSKRHSVCCTKGSSGSSSSIVCWQKKHVVNESHNLHAHTHASNGRAVAAVDSNRAVITVTNEFSAMHGSATHMYFENVTLHA
jgi:hypothetical protein